MAASASLQRRIPALDGLRGIAVLSVVTGHVTGQFPRPLVWPNRWIYDALCWGWPGVDSFFVLSGFLITGILLDARGLGDRPRHGYFTAFYARRILRIVPVYYLYLLWVCCIHPLPASVPLWPYWTYLSNVAFLGHSAAPAGQLGPLWSLSVEEQFYLVWPAVIAFAPRRHLPTICWSIIATSALSALALTVGGDYGAAFNLARMDELAAGGLVAILARDASWSAVRRRAPHLLAAGAVVFMLAFTLMHVGTATVQRVTPVV